MTPGNGPGRAGHWAGLLSGYLALKPQNEEALLLAPEQDVIDEGVEEEQQPAAQDPAQEGLPFAPEEDVIDEAAGQEPEVPAPPEEEEQQPAAQDPAQEGLPFAPEEDVIDEAAGQEPEVSAPPEEEEQQPAAQALKVIDLKPSTPPYFTLRVKIVRKVIDPVKRRETAECTVGDETAMILFTARKHQVALMEEGSTVVLRDAKIEKWYGGSIRLAVDSNGFIETHVEPAQFPVNEALNLSYLKYRDWS